MCRLVLPSHARAARKQIKNSASTSTGLNIRRVLFLAQRHPLVNDLSQAPAPAPEQTNSHIPMAIVAIDSEGTLTATTTGMFDCCRRCSCWTVAPQDPLVAAKARGAIVFLGGALKAWCGRRSRRWTQSPER